MKRKKVISIVLGIFIIATFFIINYVFSSNFEMKRGYNNLSNNGVGIDVNNTFRVKGDGSTVDLTVNSTSVTAEDAVTINDNLTVGGTVQININSSQDFFIGASSAVFNNGVAFASYTEAELKVTTPTAAGLVLYDSTNKALVLTTGTATCTDYGLIYDGGTVPTGW